MTGDDDEYYPLNAADDVTDEIMEMAWDKVEGWYMDAPVDWEDVWDRMDGSRLDNGKRLDMGGSLDTPAMKKIKREMQKRKREANA